MVRSRSVGRIQKSHVCRRCACIAGVALALWSGVARAAPEASGAREPSVIVISLDGTPPDVTSWDGLPALAGLVRGGSRAERLVPVFPTNTFPNHVTLATGVVPEVHGITGNVFQDPVRGLFRYSDDPTWIEVEPIWSWVERHGVVSAAFHWVGSQGPWRNGIGPRHWKPFDDSTPEAEKVEQILAWLDLPDAERPRLVTCWFRGGDGAGHLHGPGSEPVRRALGPQDAALSRLVQGLEERGLLETTTLLVLSDHGMARVDHVVDLDAALRHRDIPARVLGGGGFVTVSLREGADRVQDVIEAARALGLEAHRRSEAPPALRLGHIRFGDVVVIAPAGTAISRSDPGKPAMRGAHGYRSSMKEMGALFVAFGRGAEAGGQLGSVRAVDVAPTALALLGLPVPDWMEGRPIPALIPRVPAPERGVR